MYVSACCAVSGEEERQGRGGCGLVLSGLVWSGLRNAFFGVDIIPVLYIGVVVYN